MKKFIKKTFKAFTVISFFTFATSFIFNRAGKMKEVSSEEIERSFSIDVPDGWEDLQGQLNKEAVIEVGKQDEDLYLVAIPYDKSHYESFKKFCDYLIDYMQKMYDQYTMVSSVREVRNGQDVYIVEGTLLFEENLYENFVYAIEYPNRYLFVMAWAPQDREADSQKDFEAIIDTIRHI